MINKKNKEPDAQRWALREFRNDFNNTCVKNKETFHEFILKIFFSNKNYMLELIFNTSLLYAKFTLLLSRYNNNFFYARKYFDQDIRECLLISLRGLQREKQV